MLTNRLGGMDLHGAAQWGEQGWNMGGQEKQAVGTIGGKSCPLTDHFTRNIASSVALQNNYRGMTPGEVAWWTQVEKPQVKLHCGVLETPTNGNEGRHTRTGF